MNRGLNNQSFSPPPNSYQTLSLIYCLLFFIFLFFQSEAWIPQERCDGEERGLRVWHRLLGPRLDWLILLDRLQNWARLTTYKTGRSASRHGLRPGRWDKRQKIPAPSRPYKALCCCGEAPPVTSRGFACSKESVTLFPLPNSQRRKGCFAICRCEVWDSGRG